METKIDNWKEAMNRLLQVDGYIVFGWPTPLKVGSIAPDVFNIGPMRVVGDSSREEGLNQTKKVEEWMREEIEPPPRKVNFYRIVPALEK